MTMEATHAGKKGSFERLKALMPRNPAELWAPSQSLSTCGASNVAARRVMTAVPLLRDSRAIPQKVPSSSVCDLELTAGPKLLHGSRVSGLAGQLAPTVPIPANVTVLSDKVNKLQMLGEGKFGSVFRAQWAGVAVAVKEPRSGEAVLKEAELLNQLRHPNVITLFGVLEERESVGLVMEYMASGSLRKGLNLLREQGEDISLQRVLKICCQVAAGMDSLHSRGVVHLDLKCDNLMCDLRCPDRPVVKIGDLGLAERKEADGSVRGFWKGTPGYMAPEVCGRSGHRITEKADTYSFGVVLMEIWCLRNGKKLFASYESDPKAFEADALWGRLELEVPPDCEPKLAHLMQACLNEDPADRPSFRQIVCRLGRMLQRLAHQTRAAPAAATATACSQPAAPIRDSAFMAGESGAQVSAVGNSAQLPRGQAKKEEDVLLEAVNGLGPPAAVDGDVSEGKAAPQRTAAQLAGSGLAAAAAACGGREPPAARTACQIHVAAGAVARAPRVPVSPFGALAMQAAVKRDLEQTPPPPPQQQQQQQQQQQPAQGGQAVPSVSRRLPAPLSVGEQGTAEPHVGEEASSPAVQPSTPLAVSRTLSPLSPTSTPAVARLPTPPPSSSPAIAWREARPAPPPPPPPRRRSGHRWRLLLVPSSVLQCFAPFAKVNRVHPAGDDVVEWLGGVLS